MNKIKKFHFKRTFIVIIIIILTIALIAKVRSNNKLSNGKNQIELTSANTIVVDINMTNTIDNNEVKDNANQLENLTTNNIENKTSTNKNTSTNTSKNTNITTNNTTSNSNTKASDNKIGSNGLAVLMYHFFYDKNVESGHDNNWFEISEFEEQMKYLEDNNFYFPTWDEVEKYIDGKIELPKKSIVITVDDGDPSFFKLALPVIEKHNIKATEFIVTGWYAELAQQNKSSNMYYESHSDLMHQAGKNGKGVMMSWTDEQILQDLKSSQDKLGGATVFCYPFGQYTENSEKLVKQAGFNLAFTTKGGRIKKGADKYALPRVRIYSGVTLASFKSIVNY